MDAQQCRAEKGSWDGKKCKFRRLGKSGSISRTTFWVTLLSSVVASVVFLFLVHYSIDYFYPEPQYPAIECLPVQPTPPNAEGECMGRYDPSTNLCYPSKCEYSQQDQDKLDNYQKAVDRHKMVVFYTYASISLLAMGAALTLTNIAMITSGLLVGIASVIIGLTTTYKSGLYVIITLVLLLVFIAAFIWKYQRRNS